MTKLKELINNLKPQSKGSIFARIDALERKTQEMEKEMKDFHAWITPKTNTEPFPYLREPVTLQGGFIGEALHNVRRNK